MSWSEFFRMGGYGLYVWSSYALALIILIFNVLQPLRHHRRTLRRLARREARRES